ncbi:Ion channel, partial [Ostertagia ostertagi]
MIPEVRLQSPFRVFEQRFLEHRCCDDKDFKREVWNFSSDLFNFYIQFQIIIAFLPYIIISMLSILYVMGGAAAFSLIDDSIAKIDYASRCFFVFSTLTTIDVATCQLFPAALVIDEIIFLGYGNVSPGNSLSKIFCMFYVSVGIPLLLLALTNIGHLFAEIYWTLTLSVFSDLSVDPESRRKVPVPIITVFLLLHAIVGGFLFCYWIRRAAIPSFCLLQNFSIGTDGRFVSITTIGFGDIVVTPTSDFHTIVLIIYLVFGIITMSMFVNSMVQHAEWVHYMGRRKIALRKKTVWFGADSLTVQQLVQLVAKNLDV